MVRNELKGGSTPSNISAERHKEAVSVQTGQELNVNTACGEAFDKNPPPLFLSAVNFNVKRAEAIHPGRPERRLE